MKRPRSPGSHRARPAAKTSRKRNARKGQSRERVASSVSPALASTPPSLKNHKAESDPASRGNAGRSLGGKPPRATYRLQFQKDFTFDDAAAIVPYLADLGISHVYASPIHKARPGSLHGYDVVDHAIINPELGGETGLRRFSDVLRKNGLGLILDIVPNHVGIGAENQWWQSVLEWGELSVHANAFDIDWERLGANHKLVVPFLGNRYGVALENGELALFFDPDKGSFSVSHFEQRFPLCPPSYPIILDRALAALEEIAPPPEILAISEKLRLMGEESVAERRSGFPADAELLKQELARAVSASKPLAQAIERAVALINGTVGVPESFGTLHRLLEAQSYRLAHWRVAASDINYRRFFDINDLAGLRMEEDEVFDRVHETVHGLIREGIVDGLRIDHVDGLADPESYLRRLQGAAGPLFIVVEKILEPGEDLKPWPIAGTTGYDVLNLIDGVLTDKAAGSVIEGIYRRFTGVDGSYYSLLRQAKSDVLEQGFASELEVLVSDLKRIADADRKTRDYTTVALREALREIIARFPVYRSYIGEETLSREDRSLIESTIASAQRHSALPDRSVHEFIASALLERWEAQSPGSPDVELVQRFRRRFQQLTGPVMAKGLEDTLFYRYVPLLSRNEVGGDPGQFGVKPAEFHAANAKRSREWPYSMIASATHDTKRGEDARARISALCQLPDEWAEALRLWRKIAAPHLVSIEGSEAPDANDQMLILQSLLGAWPLELLNGTRDGRALASFASRMEAYLLKALREAKSKSSWVNPDEAYEAAATRLLQKLLEPRGRFLQEFAPFARRIATLGMLTGLSRTVLKCTLPGVPDVYQGTEFWDYSLVDPDNRRPVDYKARERALQRREPAARLFENWSDGRIKQHVLASILRDRAGAAALYAEGDYRPIEAAGRKKRHVLAFQRSLGKDALVVIVSRLLGELLGANELPSSRIFADLSLRLPEGRWRNVLTGEELRAEGDEYPVGELFATLPVAVLRSKSRRG
ncbi:MAG: malto-oligosyltrehalose synthase [Hyphomicrobiales bacterium]|nr:malto-oligosyltrehalose synthase [Hyphomicrobiales bacterium]